MLDQKRSLAWKYYLRSNWIRNYLGRNALAALLKVITNISTAIIKILKILRKIRIFNIKRLSNQSKKLSKKRINLFKKIVSLLFILFLHA
jgi:hypothetical protein